MVDKSGVQDGNKSNRRGQEYGDAKLCVFRRDVGQGQVCEQRRSLGRRCEEEGRYWVWLDRPPHLAYCCGGSFLLENLMHFNEAFSGSTSSCAAAASTSSIVIKPIETVYVLPARTPTTLMISPKLLRIPETQGQVEGEDKWKKTMTLFRRPRTD